MAIGAPVKISRSEQIAGACCIGNSAKRHRWNLVPVIATTDKGTIRTAGDDDLINFTAEQIARSVAR